MIESGGWEWNKADYNLFLFQLNCILGDNEIKALKINKI